MIHELMIPYQHFYEQLDERMRCHFDRYLKKTYALLEYPFGSDEDDDKLVWMMVLRHYFFIHTTPSTIDKCSMEPDTNTLDPIFE